MIIYVVAEIEGGSILQAFRVEQDAWSFIHWAEAMQEIYPFTYTVKEVRMRDV